MLKIESPSASRQYSSARPVEWISSVNQKTKLSGDHLAWHKFVPSFLAHDIFFVSHLVLGVTICHQNRWMMTTGVLEKMSQLKQRAYLEVKG